MRIRSIACSFVITLLLAACGPAAPSLAPAISTGPIPAPTETSTRPSPSAVPPATAEPELPGPTPTNPLDTLFSTELSTVSVRTFSASSPDGFWRAETFLVGTADEYLGYYAVHTRLVVQDFMGAVRWSPYGEWQEGLGITELRNFVWSADSRYLFFYDTGNAHPCPLTFTRFLRRLDLSDGSVAEIPLDELGLNHITVSPDARLLVYQAQDGFTIRELETGEARLVPVEWGEGFAQIWHYAWSPDGKTLAFSVNQNYDPMCPGPTDPASTGTSLRLLDVGSGKIRSLTENDTRNLSIADWPDPGALRVFLDGETPLFVIETGEVLPDPSLAAIGILSEYLNSLALGGSGLGHYSYERAAGLYGGSDETLFEYNPDLDPQNRAALLQAACEVNGFQCLRILEIVSTRPLLGVDGAFDVLVTVRLRGPYDSVFALGPCCGAEFGPQQTEFTFTVRIGADAGAAVLELPPYQP